MDDEVNLEKPWAVKLKMSGRRPQMGTKIDGRYGPINMSSLEQAIGYLVRRIDEPASTYVLGIPEGGLVPAYAFAKLAGLQVLFASCHEPASVDYIQFEEEHDLGNKSRFILGLKAGDRVVIVEDEVTTGKTVVNCIQALRSKNIECDTVATIYFSNSISAKLLLNSHNINIISVALFSKEELLKE